MHHHTAITCTKAWNIVCENKDEKIFGFMEVKKNIYKKMEGDLRKQTKRRGEEKWDKDTQKGKV